MIGGDRLRDILQEHRLAGSRRRNNQGPLSLANGCHDIDDPRREIFPRRVGHLELEALVRIKGSQIVKMNFMPDFFRILEIDRIDLKQREIALPFLGTANQPFHRIAGAQAEPADLRRRNINVVGTGQIIRIGRAKEAEAILQDFDDAFANDFDVAARQLFQNREHQLLLAHDRSVLDFVFFREGKQLGRRLKLQVLQFNFLHRD